MQNLKIHPLFFQSQRKDQFVSLARCFTTRLVNRQREYTTKRNKTVAYYQGGEHGLGFLSVKVLRVALWESENCQKCSKSLLAMAGNKEGAKGFWRDLELTLSTVK